MSSPENLTERSIIPPGFYARPTTTVAPELLGALLVRADDTGLLVGRIVETEAYTGDDPASHSFRGPTPRNRVMFGPPGHAYVYFIYGRYHCFNVVTEPEGSGAAVLVRAVEPIRGERAMRDNRSAGRKAGPAAGRSNPKFEEHPTNGPGKLCMALGITGADNGTPLYEADGRIRLYHPARPPRGAEIGLDTRVGIQRGADLQRRFFLTNSLHLSRRPGPHAV